MLTNGNFEGHMRQILIWDTPQHSGWEALTIIFEKFWFWGLRLAALAYVDAYTMLKVFL